MIRAKTNGEINSFDERIYHGRVMEEDEVKDGYAARR